MIKKKTSRKKTRKWLQKIKVNENETKKWQKSRNESTNKLMNEK